MEGFSFKIVIGDSQIIIRDKDFVEQPEVVSQEQIKQQFHKNMRKDEVRVINYFIYYILFVEFKLKIPDYQTRIRSQISEYYIRCGMKIKVYEFSDLCSKILNFEIHECMHIIYYLVYGRFASPSYVNSIIASKATNLSEISAKKMQSQINRNSQQVVLQSNRFLDKKISYKSKQKETDLEMFARNLTEIMKVKKSALKNEAVKQERALMENTAKNYQIKIKNFNSKQNSPIINLLRHKSQQMVFEMFKENKKISSQTTNNFMNQLNNTKKQKNHITIMEKGHKEYNRISLKTANQIKQKIKNENQFLDQLRTTLVSQQDHAKMLRKKNFQKKQDSVEVFNDIINIQDSNTNNNNKQQSMRIVDQPRQANNTEYCQIFNVEQAENYNENQNLHFRFTSTNKKMPFKQKIVFYKQKYKEFLSVQSKRAELF